MFFPLRPLEKPSSRGTTPLMAIGQRTFEFQQAFYQMHLYSIERVQTLRSTLTKQPPTTNVQWHWQRGQLAVPAPTPVRKVFHTDKSGEVTKIQGKNDYEHRAGGARRQRRRRQRRGAGGGDYVRPGLPDPAPHAQEPAVPSVWEHMAGEGPTPRPRDHGAHPTVQEVHGERKHKLPVQGPRAAQAVEVAPAELSGARRRAKHQPGRV